MTWEALNNISDDNDRNLVIVVNDNGRSYARRSAAWPATSTGAHDRRYENCAQGRTRSSADSGRARVYRGVRGGTHGFLSRFTNNGAVLNLDIKYLGPIDGHDLVALDETLQLAKAYRAPVIVHVITEKGRGYEPARNDEADQFHAVGKIDPATGEPSAPPMRRRGPPSPTLVEAGERRDDIIAITAAMLRPTGLQPFAQKFPTASTTSASPSSTPWHPPLGSPSGACTPSSRSTPRS
jgi:1-deoxy-D-xylulose-5-phosphate synthase